MGKKEEKNAEEKRKLNIGKISFIFRITSEDFVIPLVHIVKKHNR